MRDSWWRRWGRVCWRALLLGLSASAGMWGRTVVPVERALNASTDGHSHLPVTGHPEKLVPYSRLSEEEYFYWVELEIQLRRTRVPRRARVARR